MPLRARLAQAMLERANERRRRLDPFAGQRGLEVCDEGCAERGVRLRPGDEIVQDRTQARQLGGGFHPTRRARA